MITHRVTVIFDGIENSVFYSQVLAPLEQWVTAQDDRTAVVISFERMLLTVPSTHPRIRIVQIKRTPYLGRWSLLPLIWQLRIYLDQPHELYARGPLAGYCALQARTDATIFLSIQARGLCAEEYRYAHRAQTGFFKRLYHRVRYWTYRTLERIVYSESSIDQIECVSPALAEYIIATFGADRSICRIASSDFIKPLTLSERLSMREEIRKQLAIPSDAIVYCYSGSAHAWQCPQQIGNYFAQQLIAKQNAYLVIYTPAVAAFQAIADKLELPKEHLRILTIEPKELVRYLTAGDYGLLFREMDVINWVARPTKALEYEAAGLAIVHNNTVAFLIDRTSAARAAAILHQQEQTPALYP